MRAILTTSIAAFLATMSVVSAVPGGYSSGGDTAYIDNSNTNSPHLVNAPVTAPIKVDGDVKVKANVASPHKVKRCNKSHENVKKLFPQGKCGDGQVYIDNSNKNSPSLINAPVNLPVDACVPIEIIANVLSGKIQKRWDGQDNDGEGDPKDSDEGEESHDDGDHQGGSGHQGGGSNGDYPGHGGSGHNGEGSGPCPPGFAYVDNSNTNSGHLVNLPVTAPVKACVPVKADVNVLSKRKEKSEHETDENEKDENEKDEKENTKKDDEQ